MGKLKLARHEENQVLEPSFQRSLITGYSKCEMMIPGVGRLRTGEKHPNFHRVEPRPEIEVQQVVSSPIPEKVTTLR